MSNSESSQICEELLQKVAEINLILKSEESLTADGEEISQLLSKRKQHLEALFEHDNHEWLSNNLERLQHIKDENDEITNIYSTKLNEIKDELVKAKRSKKNINAYKNSY